MNVQDMTDKEIREWGKLTGLKGLAEHAILFDDKEMLKEAMITEGVSWIKCGWDLPKNRGGELIRNTGADLHSDYVREVYDMFDERNHKKLSKLNVTDIDLKAFDKWIDEKGFFNGPESFLIQYLNAAKIGSNVRDEWRGIDHADNMPFKRFQEYVRRGYFVGNFNGDKFWYGGYKYNDETGLFEKHMPSEMDIQEERAKREQLQEEVGQHDIGYDPYNRDM